MPTNKSPHTLTSISNRLTAAYVQLQLRSCVTDKEEKPFVQKAGWPTLIIKWKTRSRTYISVSGKSNFPGVCMNFVNHAHISHGHNLRLHIRYF